MLNLIIIVAVVLVSGGPCGNCFPGDLPWWTLLKRRRKTVMFLLETVRKEF